MLQEQLKPHKDYTLQWHVLNRCEMNCQHCYIRDRQQEMSLAQFKKGISNYKNFLGHFNLRGRIYFTGGDFLLHKSFKAMIKMTIDKGIVFAIMGNYHRLTLKNIFYLKKSGIKFYQLSIDGLKINHELTRGIGTFNKVIEAINLLEDNGITTVVNMTVTKNNISDVVPLINLLAKTKLSRFDITRVVPIGSALYQKIKVIKPLEYKKLLLSILRAEAIIRKINTKLEIGKKDHLWKLLYYEKNRLSLDLSNICYGCGMVIRHMTVLPNGEILPCRKLELPIGNILHNSLRDVFEKNMFANDICKNTLIKGCMGCQLKNVCRGCPSVTYGYYNDFNHQDPQCWKK